MTSSYSRFSPGSGGGGAGITSINGNATAAQIIAAGTGISVTSVAGTTTITNTGGAGGGAYVVTGSIGTPTLIDTGITPADLQREIIILAGDGAPVTLTDNPQIVGGTIIGQELMLIGNDDTNTVTMNDGTGLNLNGPCLLHNHSTISFIWDGANWTETSRNDI